MSNRIVLVDPFGDELFSGVSVTAKAADRAGDLDDDLEPCPETLRSPVNDSGIFVTARPVQIEEIPPSGASGDRAA